MNDVQQQLRNHTSVRKYTGEEIPKEKVYELLQTAQMAATSHFVQAYSVIHVTDAAKKQKLGELSRNEFQFKTAGASLLFCVDFKRLQIAGQKYGIDITADTAENILVGVNDVGLFAQNFVVAAESEGYGICYIGGARTGAAEISELFNLPDYVFPMFAMTVGTPTKTNDSKPRLPIEAIVHENGYDIEKYDTLLTQYDEALNNYYLNRNANQKNENWTRQMADYLVNQQRPHIKEFLASKGFNWK